jgi:hypothetical protein
VSQRSASPSKFESQATSSPSKLNVPNRKQRNQPANRVHDIEFATEISTSLLSQVRNLQALLAEKEEALKAVSYEKSRLEVEAEGFSERLRSLDESEQRYKDENWNLETQIHEYIASSKEAVDREKKLTQSLNILQSEKSAAQKELDDIKLSHAKLSEDHAAALKHHDVELGSVKRNITMAENERGVLQRKVDDLIGQNSELAKAVAHQRGRLEDRDQARGLSDEDFDTAPDNVTPEHSPPPSPVKGTPRHSMLESETLKSSLHHAHRMIQNLKSNIHREKTEKLELKRMLQDARDELESRRNDGMGSGTKRNRKKDSVEFKKPLKPGQLGGLRNSRSEVFVDDPNWEEDNGQGSPSHARSFTRLAAGASIGAVSGEASTDSSDHFETANEATDEFETANERATETEDFHTGAEDISGSDELTETEGGATGTLRNRPAPLALTKPGNRDSWQSTASASGDEYSYEEVRTPTVSQPQRLRLKVSRLGNRRSRLQSEEPQLQQSSPASFASSSKDGTPQPGQSLFAELGDMSDEDESFQGTPSRSGFPSQSSTPASRPTSRPSTARGTPAPSALGAAPPVPKLPMVDSAMMTEPWEQEPRPATPQTAVPYIAGAAVGGAALTEAMHVLAGQDTPTNTNLLVSDAASPRDSNQVPNMLLKMDNEGSRPISTSTYSDMSSQYDPDVMDEKLAKFPSPPTSRAQTPMVSLASPEPKAAPLTMSTIYSEDVAPQSPAKDTPAPLTMSSIYSEQVVPESPATITFTPLTISTIVSEHVVPTSPAKVVPIPLTLSTIASQHVVPVSPSKASPPPLSISTIHSEHVEPESPILPPRPKQIVASLPKSAPIPPPLDFSSIRSIDTEPIEPLPLRSPRRDAVMIPRDADEGNAIPQERPETPPKASIIGSLFGRKRDPATPIIAEDETRQSPSDSPMEQTPESQRPLRELSNNPHERSLKKAPVETIDESSQTALTAEQIDEMFKVRRQGAILAEDSSKSAQTRGVAPMPVALRARKSQESIGSIGRARSKMADPDFINDTVLVKRPGSAGSGRKTSISSTHPPLPMDHKQVIAAAAQRSGSSNGPGSMGPPPLPTAYRANSTFRPRTPSNQIPLSPTRTGSTPRALQSSSYNNGEVQSPPGTARSRRSSVSSFTSELDNRFNLRPGMIPNLEPGTDPRMINAITQTMIGEYLWKYTRKAGRGTMSEKRHRRYFWVHPYTRTLYWSDQDPALAGRAELKGKSVPIEAVRVVTDDNPLPPGLHRKSLVIIPPGRTVKFTAQTGQRHETWFNALSYLLLRTGEEDANVDTSEVVNGALTREDVDEFNPQFRGKSRPGPPSLSSYNSRTTRNDSPARKSSQRMSIQPQPALPTATRPTMGTLSRLSNYWTAGRESKMGSFSSKRSRHSISGNGGSIYEASEVHDSAEDLREMIEKQDRESDKLENVRACCDGKLTQNTNFNYV